MPTEAETINSFNELTSELITRHYLPTIYELTLKRRRAELVNKIPRNSDDVEGLQVYITYLTKIPWAWRAMSEYGYTPTGAKYDAEEGWVNLGCHAASAIVSLYELRATEQSRWDRILDKNMRWIGDTFPYYLRALLWSSQNSKHAIGAVSGVSGQVITLDTSTLWYTHQTDVAKLFVDGMYIQAYSGSSKVGEPMRVEAVYEKDGQIEVDQVPSSGLSSGDLLVMSDVGGLDQPYDLNVPGVYDVIDDNNTFQGIDRSSAGSKFQPVIRDAAGETLNYALLRNFFHDCYDPAYASTSREIVEKYWSNNIASGVRFTPGGMYVDGVGEGVQIDATVLQVDDDIPAHDVVVADHENWRIADRGGINRMFNEGWQRVPNRPFITQDFEYWFTLLAEDTRHFGRMHSVTESA